MIIIYYKDNDKNTYSKNETANKYIINCLNPPLSISVSLTLSREISSEKANID